MEALSPSAPVPTLRDLGFYETEEVAALVGAKLLTLRNWRASGKGPPYTKVHGTRIVYPVNEFKQWLASRTVKSRNEPTLVHGSGRRPARGTGGAA